MKKIRVLVADDHAIVRMGLVSLLGTSSQFDVVGEAFDGQDAVQKALADSIELLNKANPSEAVLKLKSYEAFQKAADGKATKIIIPSEIQSLSSLVTSVKEVATEPAAE